jgi:hypothetical protein
MGVDGDGLLHLGEYLDQAMPDGFAVIAGFGGEVAEQAAVAHAFAVETVLVHIDKGA